MEDKFMEIIKSYDIDAPSVEGVLYAVSDILKTMAEKTKEEEPEAWRSIENMEKAAMEVIQLVWYMYSE